MENPVRNTKIDTMQNCFDIALCSNVGNLAAMKPACMASTYHICGHCYDAIAHLNIGENADFDIMELLKIKKAATQKH